MPAFNEKPMESASNLAQEHTGENGTQFSVLNQLRRHLGASENSKSIFSVNGQSGSGKTWILRQLEQQFANACHLAYIDLSLGHRTNLLIEDPLLALLFLRTKLSHNYFVCPLFDLLIASYFYQRGLLNRRTIREIYPARDRLLMLQLWVILEQEKWSDAGPEIIQCFRQLLKTQFDVYLAAHGLTCENIADYLRYSDRTIPQILPEVLAHELNYSVNLKSTPGKIVLLFDNVLQPDEKFRNPSYCLIQRWLEPLIGNLDFDKNIILIATSDSSNPKDDLLSLKIQETQIEILAVQTQNIANNVAAREQWLSAFPDQGSIWDHIATRNDELMPYAFGVCHDIMTNRLEQDKNVAISDFIATSGSFKKSQFHMRKLLHLSGRENAYALIALSAARWFDMQMYIYLGENLNFEATQPGFDTITSYSFTEMITCPGFTTYRFNAKACEDIQSYSTKALVEAHFVLERYFLKRVEHGDKVAVCEAIYHLAHAKWEQATVKWITEFELAMKAGNNTLLHGLISILPALPNKSLFWRGRVFQSVAAFFQRGFSGDVTLQFLNIARESFAARLKSDPDDMEAQNSKGVVIFEQGKVLQENGALSHSTSTFAEAMICFSRLIEKNKSLVAAQLNNILIHIVKAQGYSLLDQSGERIKQLELASEQLATLLENAPAMLPAINTFARLQMKLAREYQQSHQDDLVFQRMDTAIELFKKCVGESNTPDALLRAHAQTHWDAACIYADYGAYYEADDFFKSAVKLAETYSQKERSLPAALFLAEIMNAYATLQIRYLQLTSANKILQDATTLLNEQRWAYPKNIDINNILGSIALQRAEVHLLTFDYKSVQHACSVAHQHFSAVTWFNKSNIRARQGLALVAARRAALASACSDFSNATDYYINAEKLIEAIPVESLSVDQFSNALNLYLEYASFLFDRGNNKAALAGLTKTNQLYLKHRNYFPASNPLQIVRAKYLLVMAKIHLTAARYIDAAELLDKNLKHLQKILNGAPNHLNAMLLKVETFLASCQLHIDLGKTGEAVEKVSLALQHLEMTLENGITIPDVLNGKARALTVLATIQNEAGYFDQTRENLQSAINLFDEVLTSAPMDLYANTGKSEVYLKMAELSFRMAEFELALKYCSYAKDQFKEKDALLKNPIVRRLNLDINLHESRIFLAEAKLSDAENICGQIVQEVVRLTVESMQDFELHLLKVDVLLLQSTIADRAGRSAEAIDLAMNAIESLQTLADGRPDSVIINNNIGLAYIRLADGYIARNAPQKALKALRTAITAFDSVLKFAPENPVLKNNKANAMLQLATVFSATEGSQAAAEMLKQSADIYENLTSLYENDTTAIYNRGLTAAKSAYVFTSLQNMEAALGAFKKSISCFDAAIAISPACVDFHQKRGDAYFGSGLLFISMQQINEAMQCLKTAVEAFDAALKLRENNSHSLYSRGKTLLHLGELQNQIGEKGRALWSYQQAGECFVHLLDKDKSQLQVVKNLADVNLAIGELQVSFSQHNDAFTQFLNAVKLYDMVLGTDHETGQVKFNQALALEKIAGIHESRRERAQAIKYYNKAKNLYHNLCENNPSMNHARYQLGHVLVELGKIYFDNKDEHDAKLCLKTAISTLSFDFKNFNLEPMIARKRGQAHVLLAEYFEHQGSLLEANEEFTAAIASFDLVLQGRSDEANLHYEHGIAAAGLAALQRKMTQNDVAIRSYEKAVRSFDAALQIEPEMLTAHYQKAASLKSSSELLILANRHEPAKVHLKSALDQLTHALAINPSDHAILELWRHVQEAFAQFEEVPQT